MERGDVIGSAAPGAEDARTSADGARTAEGRALAIGTMERFAERTGLTSDRTPVRYLWTDAFAVCNCLALHCETGEERYLTLARALVDQVHHVLGRHREDDPRVGWISSLSEDEGELHPTAGGLRIGKPRGERAPSEPHHPTEEWDRDGQYYHYLTKWMFALARMWRVTGEGHYHRWAVELAHAAHAGFLIGEGGGRRLFWKMSVDLSRPLVSSSGHHDPLDGLVTTSVLVATRPSGEDAADGLERELRDLGALCEGRHWATDDPLGIGGLLVDTLRTGQLAALGSPVGSHLYDRLVRDSLRSLHALGDLAFMRGAPARRLAFRELGLALGLDAIERLAALDFVPSGARLGRREVEAMARLGSVGRALVDFWSTDYARSAPTWTEHLDISDVMWATCLVPEGFLSL